jgi:hypothetical protein
MWALRGGEGQFHVPVALSPGKVPWHPMERALAGLQSWSRRWKKRNLLEKGQALTDPIKSKDIPGLN